MSTHYTDLDGQQVLGYVYAIPEGKDPAVRANWVRWESYSSTRPVARRVLSEELISAWSDQVWDHIVQS